MKSYKFLIFTLVLLATLSSASHAEEYLNGNLSQITSIPEGLLIMLDNGVPAECEGTPYNWMIVKEENISMVSVVLTMFALEKRKNVTVYTKPYTGNGFCEVTQVQPYLEPLVEN